MNGCPGSISNLTKTLTATLARKLRILKNVANYKYIADFGKFFSFACGADL